MAYVVRKPTVPADNEVTSQDSTNSSNVLQNGDGNDLSAICDYVPITLPPENSGEIPIKRTSSKELARIVGGSDTYPYEFPFMVAMLIDDEYFCGGSLIDERHVLTAAHCTSNAKKLELYFGVYNMTADEDTRQYRVVYTDENVFEHPKYNKYTSANDIAVIRLTERIKSNAYVQPLYLPSVYSLGNSFSGWNLTTTGWGDTNGTSSERDEGKIHPILKKSTATVITNEECRKHYRNLVTGNFICTRGSLTGSPCAGDTGGPLVAKFVRRGNVANDVPAEVSDDQVHQCVFSKSHRHRVKQEKTQPGNEVSEWFVQIGVLSFGSEACGSGPPAAFTRVTAYMDFISPILEDNFRKVDKTVNKDVRKFRN